MAQQGRQLHQQPTVMQCDEFRHDQMDREVGEHQGASECSSTTAAVRLYRKRTDRLRLKGRPLG